MSKDRSNVLTVISSIAIIILTISTARAQINAVYTDTPVRIDGSLHDAAWENAEVVTGFTQQELTEGAPATERTEVRILFDDENLYVGVMCFDSQPERIVHKVMERDGGLGSDDRFNLVIDTYNDQRGGYYFGTNPNGMMYDGTLSAVGNDKLNDNWDGIWDTRARITDRGWSCEMVIPFKTLRFPVGDMQVWGINFKRAIMRNNEEALWRSWRRNEGIREIGTIGTITIDRTLKSSRQLDIKPYVLGGVENVRGEASDDTFNYGLDVKYGISTNTTLDLTTKTDFAQIESDKEIINLTRFNVSFPEKRDFFLEGSDTFDFTQGRMRMFYSRRVGLSDDGGEIPIAAGAKLTQKTAGYRLGFLSVQTEETGDTRAANHSVFRVKKDILGQSYVGMILTNLAEDGGHDNQVVAADIGYKTTILGGQVLEIQSYLAGSITDGDTKDNLAGRLYINMPNDTFSSRFLYHAREAGFNPESGFADRLDVQQYMADYYWTPRVSIPGMPFIKKMAFCPFALNAYYDMSHNLMSREVSFQVFGIESTSEDEFEIDVEHVTENHDVEFDLFEDIVIPVGDYDWWRTQIMLETSARRMLSTEAEIVFSDYYGGKRQMYEAECTFKHNRFYSLSAEVTYNDIEVMNRSFDTKEFGGRLTLDLSTRLFSSTFVQWNNETDEIIANFRLHYIPKVGSDIYLVYNHILDEQYDIHGNKDDFRTSQQAGMVKVNYTYRY